MENIYKPRMICVGSDTRFNVQICYYNIGSHSPKEENGKIHYILVCPDCRIDYFAAAPWDAINYAKNRIEVKGRGTAYGKIRIMVIDEKTEEEYLGMIIEKVVHRKYIPLEAPRKKVRR